MLLLNAMASTTASGSPANIDDGGVVLRLRRSIYAFAAALALVFVLSRLGVGRSFYALSALPFWGAFSLAYQGLFKT